jgi:hypothetical protein
MERSGIGAGAVVVVQEEFDGEGHDALRFKKGQQGVVAETDDEGNALVQFMDHKRKQWIFKKDLKKLKVAYTGNHTDASAASKKFQVSPAAAPRVNAGKTPPPTEFRAVSRSPSFGTDSRWAPQTPPRTLALPVKDANEKTWRVPKAHENFVSPFPEVDHIDVP